MRVFTVVQRRFTVTIPKKVREALGIKEGTELLWEVRGSEVVVKPVSLRGLVGRFEGEVSYTREAKEDVERLLLAASERK